MNFTLSSLTRLHMRSALPLHPNQQSILLLRFLKKSLPIAALLCLSCVTTTTRLSAIDASQLGMSELQSEADSLVNQGNLIQAMPLLKELIIRVEASSNSEIKLDFPVFLIGTAYIQSYVATNKPTDLSEALIWYDKLEQKYPFSGKLKGALLKKISVLRILKREPEAIELMKKLLSGAYRFRLSQKETTQLLKDLTQIYYGKSNWEEGLPVFTQLLNTAVNIDDQAWAGAASFEAYIAEKRLDDAMSLLPVLARESEIRYMPRLNVALLKASDTMVAKNRLEDTAILLSLIKTTDIMIEYQEAQVKSKEATIKFRTDMGKADEKNERLGQEVKQLKATLKQLRKLPTLRSALQVRRARNYSKTARLYEAFWMFFDLMNENPKEEQIQFYYYATFSNALRIKKLETAIEVGKAYRSKFPKGDFYSDITVALVSALRQSGDKVECVQIAKEFLDNYPLEPACNNLLLIWASHLMEHQQFKELIQQASRWLDRHTDPLFEDGLYYWRGIGELQSSQFPNAVKSFDGLLKKFPTSVYAEDGLLRKGACQYYAQDFEEARETLLKYTKQYPNGTSTDQAFFFLGEIENLASNFELALEHFKKADEITTLQDIHNGAAFSTGMIYEVLQRYDDMVTHFQAYIDRFGEEGRLTDAVLQLGRAYEYLRKPCQMLTLYREFIQKYATDTQKLGVDALIESYAEKYNTNKATLEKTVEFLDALDEDIEFRTKIVTDRGFLFEYFYGNSVLDQTLYNRLRSHPQFGEWLIEDLTPINEVTAIYRKQLAEYPPETPAEFFRDRLVREKIAKQPIAETRMLMGLYRSDVEIPPTKSYDSAFLDQVSPRMLLYIADYSRADRLNFAIEAWNKVLTKYSTDDAAIVAYMRLASVSDERGDKSAAFDYLESIVTQFSGTPKLPGVILRQGELLSAMGRGEEAREKYQYILRVPDWRGIIHARALFQTGEAYMAEDMYAEAHGFFERTFLGYSQLGEWCARAYLADAEALLGLGSTTDAIATLTEARDTIAASAFPELMESIIAKLKELQP